MEANIKEGYRYFELNITWLLTKLCNILFSVVYQTIRPKILLSNHERFPEQLINLARNS